MIIEVKIFSSLRHYVSSSDNHLEGDKWRISDNATVAQALEMLNLPEQEARVLLINGRSADRERVLKEGDVLHVFPAICGG